MADGVTAGAMSFAINIAAAMIEGRPIPARQWTAIVLLFPATSVAKRPLPHPACGRALLEEVSARPALGVGRTVVDRLLLLPKQIREDQLACTSAPPST
jgi:hypothetical protein